MKIKQFRSKSKNFASLAPEWAFTVLLDPFQDLKHPSFRLGPFKLVQSGTI